MNELQQIQQRCQACFNAGAANLTGTMSLSWPIVDMETEQRHNLVFALAPGEIRWLPQHTPAQADFIFKSALSMDSLLFSSRDPYRELLDLFMAGEISSSGYLLWTFTLLGLFRGAR